MQQVEGQRLPPRRPHSNQPVLTAAATAAAAAAFLGPLLSRCKGVLLALECVLQRLAGRVLRAAQAMGRASGAGWVGLRTGLRTGAGGLGDAVRHIGNSILE